MKEIEDRPEPARMRGGRAATSGAELSVQVWLRDVGGYSGIDGEWDECWVPCAKGDPGARSFVSAESSR